MDSYQLIMLISSLIISIQLIPQNYKIYKNKRAKDISYITIGITLSGISGIMTYGIHEELVEIWVPPIIQIMLTLHMFFMKIYYDSYYKPNLKEDIYINEVVDNNISSHVSIGIRKDSIRTNSIDYKFE